jgi:hypothetical protein
LSYLIYSELKRGESKWLNYRLQEPQTVAVVYNY